MIDLIGFFGTNQKLNPACINKMGLRTIEARKVQKFIVIKSVYLPLKVICVFSYVFIFSKPSVVFYNLKLILVKKK
jgi:hypothetical protein